MQYYAGRNMPEYSQNPSMSVCCEQNIPVLYYTGVTFHSVLYYLLLYHCRPALLGTYACLRMTMSHGPCVPLPDIDSAIETLHAECNLDDSASRVSEGESGKFASASALDAFARKLRGNYIDVRTALMCYQQHNTPRDSLHRSYISDKAALT
jgi:hypothetical protein